jgi:hypothetical protein
MIVKEIEIIEKKANLMIAKILETKSLIARETKKANRVMLRRKKKSLALLWMNTERRKRS